MSEYEFENGTPYKEDAVLNDEAILKMNPMMREMVTASEFRKRIIIAIALHHRATCVGEACPISLMELAQVASLAGIRFTDEELQAFQ